MRYPNQEDIPFFICSAFQAAPQLFLFSDELCIISPALMSSGSSLKVTPIPHKLITSTRFFNYNHLPGLVVFEFRNLAVDFFVSDVTNYV